MDTEHRTLLHAAQTLLTQIQSHSSHYRTIVQQRYQDDAHEYILSQELMVSLAMQLTDELKASHFLNPNMIEQFVCQIEHLHPTNMAILAEDIGVAQDDVRSYQELGHEIRAFKDLFTQTSKRVLREQ